MHWALALPNNFSNNANFNYFQNSIQTKYAKFSTYLAGHGIHHNDKCTYVLGLLCDKFKIKKKNIFFIVLWILTDFVWDTLYNLNRADVKIFILGAQEARGDGKSVHLSTLRGKKL